MKQHVRNTMKTENEMRWKCNRIKREGCTVQRNECREETEVFIFEIVLKMLLI